MSWLLPFHAQDQRLSQEEDLVVAVAVCVEAIAFLFQDSLASVML